MHPTPTKTRLAPTEVAPDTFLIHNHQGEGTAPVVVSLNSMVIRGSEPVVVDTGVADNREQYLEDLFGLVDPEDVRWVFISHDDEDHTGNLLAVMDACPNATLVINWFMVQRLGELLTVPPTRWRWVSDGESFDAGDRRLVAVRPPIYDSPTTRGLFDPTTGLYWASDAFATPMLQPVRDAGELDEDFWYGGMVTFNHYVSPWIDIVDADRYLASVERVAALEPRVITGCHTPVVNRDRIALALEAARRSPWLEAAPQPDQSVLEEIQRSFVGLAA
jgi:flavorubredoxin